MAIEILPAPPLALTPADTSIALGNAVTLQAETEPGITQFRWTGTGVLANGGNVQTLQPERTGAYTVSITSNLGCVQTASARVRVIRPVYIPNSFTPNADGKNDLFRVPPDIDIDMVSLKVFNRFGQLVWSTADPGAGWDGKINGQPAPVGSYAYLLTYREDKTIVERKGTVTLIR
jgi:gliding motility-associated-like protein